MDTAENNRRIAEIKTQPMYGDEDKWFILQLVEKLQQENEQLRKFQIQPNKGMQEAYEEWRRLTPRNEL